VRALQRHIWCSSITVATKVRLLNAYVLPVLLYGAETWSLTAALEKKLDAFHQWCLRRLLRLSDLRHVTNVEVLHLTCQTQLSTTLRDRRLFFGHIARADSRMDHTRVLRSIISGLPRDWKRPPGRPRRTWLRTTEQDLRPVNIGLVSAWQRAQDRERWKRTVETATLQDEACSWWWWWWKRQWVNEKRYKVMWKWGSEMLAHLNRSTASYKNV